MPQIDWQFPNAYRVEENDFVAAFLAKRCYERPEPKGFTYLGRVGEVQLHRCQLPAGVWALVMQTLEPRWHKVAYFNSQRLLDENVPDGLVGWSL